jgi:hypothetical protein
MIILVFAKLIGGIMEKKLMKWVEETRKRARGKPPLELNTLLLTIALS